MKKRCQRMEMPRIFVMAFQVTSNGTTDLSNAKVNQQQQQKKSGEDVKWTHLPGSVRRRPRNLHLDPYMCNVCHQYVGGGVVTICGHLFCWTCLWPKLSGTPMPRCPRCLRHLLMYEDIMPFYGEGPHAHQRDNNVVAQLGSVPRPTGLYLCDLEYPMWFMVNDPEENFCEHIKARDLYRVLKLLPMLYPKIAAQITFLRWFQLGCVLAILLIWSAMSLTKKRFVMFIFIFVTIVLLVNGRRVLLGHCLVRLMGTVINFCWC